MKLIRTLTELNCLSKITAEGIRVTEEEESADGQLVFKGSPNMSHQNELPS